MKRVIVRGPAFSRSGYGEQTRFALRSLREHSDKFDTYLDVTPWGNTGWIWEADDERAWLDSLAHKTAQFIQHGQAHFDLSIQSVIPSEFQRLAPINVGFTAGIEASRVHPTWLQAGANMEKIIFVSKNAQDIFVNTEYKEQGLKATCPVGVAGFPLPQYEPEPIPELDFDTPFNFLVVATWIPRKNLENTIRWFLEEFHDRKDIGLVLKVHLANNSTPDRFETSARLRQFISQLGIKDRECRVHFLHGDLTDPQMLGVYNHPKIKCLVNLAHGEGFGLPVMEAASQGLPVIAPDWGGYLDFLYQPIPDKKRPGKTRNRPRFARVKYTMQAVPEQVVNSMENVFAPNSKWAYPDAGDYKMKLRSMVRDYPKYEKMSADLLAYLQEEWTFEKKAEQFVECILDLFEFSDEEFTDWLDSIEVL